MGSFRYRVIDTSGSEIAIVADDRLQIAHDETVMLPDGRTAAVLEVNDDEVDGGDGGVVATLVVDDGRQARGDCAGRAFKRSGPATVSCSPRSSSPRALRASVGCGLGPEPRVTRPVHTILRLRRCESDYVERSERSPTVAAC